MFKIQPESEGGNLYVITEGVLTHDDYQQMIPLMEELMARHGKLNCIIDATGWQGWEWKALWDDFVAGVGHFRDFGRLAIIGRDDQRWMEWFSGLYDIFRGEETKFFKPGEFRAAREWCWQEKKTGASGKAA